MSNILILGASGFIGKNITCALAEEHNITAFDCVSAPEFDKFNNIKMIQANYTETEAFDKYLENIDTVIHLISTTVPCDDTSHIPDEIRNNVIPTVRLLESMVRVGVKKIIFSSSAGAYYGETDSRINTTATMPNPYCSYGVQKAVIEDYIRFYGLRYGIDYRIMRISNPYGWGQNPNKMQGLIPIFINRLLKGEPISVFGDGENKRDYIFMSDLINAVIEICRYNGQERIFNIGYGEYYTINEIISMIEDISGKKFARIEHSDKRFCDVVSSIVDMTEAHNILNWKPAISIHEGIKSVYELSLSLAEHKNNNV